MLGSLKCMIVIDSWVVFDVGVVCHRLLGCLKCRTVIDRVVFNVGV